jgi:hypothetical protein
MASFNCMTVQGFLKAPEAWNRHLPCVFAKTAYKPRAPSILVGS